MTLLIILFVIWAIVFAGAVITDKLVLLWSAVAVAVVLTVWAALLVSRL